MTVRVRKRLEAEDIEILDMYLLDVSDFHPGEVCFIKVPESDVEKLLTDEDQVQWELWAANNLTPQEYTERRHRLWDAKPIFRKGRWGILRGGFSSSVDGYPSFFWPTSLDLALQPIFMGHMRELYRSYLDAVPDGRVLLGALWIVAILVVALRHFKAKRLREPSR